MSAAAVLDTLEMLKSAQETLLAALEQACGSCDSLCEDYARSDENTEAILQTIPQSCLHVCASAACACASLRGIW